MLARNSIWSGVKLTWKYARAHARTSRAGITIKLFAWAGISIKTFGTKKIEELNCAREYPRLYFPTMERYDILCCPVFQVVLF
jgi:hypothetical protein